mgnify:CR=1 FL=1
MMLKKDHFSLPYNRKKYKKMMNRAVKLIILKINSARRRDSMKFTIIYNGRSQKK